MRAMPKRTQAALFFLFQKKDILQNVRPVFSRPDVVHLQLHST